LKGNQEVQRRQYGWAGRVDLFLETPENAWLEELSQHHRGLYGEPESGEQHRAWRDEFMVMRSALRNVCVALPEAIDWSLAFEYELPLEGGRRPDLVVLAGDQLIVLEFKQSDEARASAIDQVQAYARDLEEYHKETHGAIVTPALVLTRARNLPTHASVDVTDAEGLASLIVRHAGLGRRDLQVWLDSPYEPLPFLVDAARMIFNNEPLPAIRRAMASGIPEAIEALERLVTEGQQDSSHHLGLVCGVPGSGKTLTGLSLVYKSSTTTRQSTFLSGNGPLVEVLQDALKSRVFVKDLHQFTKQYGLTKKVPAEHVIVFDEAQRMWDPEKFRERHGVDRSEPDLLIEIGERIEPWAVLVGLVGDGQEIHSGEEGGIGLWNTAIERGAREWHVACPSRLAASFPGARVSVDNALDLTISLRSQQAGLLHRWVADLLSGQIADAAKAATEIIGLSFPLYVTQDLTTAKKYVVDRYSAEPTARYGLLASSKSERTLKPFGVDVSFQATKRLKVAQWYNEGRDHPNSCCALTAAVTEFQCQGLEVDFPIVLWAEDFTWNGSQWAHRASRSRITLKDPFQIRQNVYRVLLTRGRDGVVVFVPPTPSLTATMHILLAAGMQLLPDS
jgi:hypothetical protein